MKQKEQRLPVFAERFRELQREMSNTEFATHLGMSRQTVGFYLNGDRIPDALSLRQIAERCSVSTDWLLGLTSTATLDQNEQTICDYTGLTLESVRTLHLANDILTNKASQELTKHIQIKIKKEKEHYAAQKTAIEHKRKIANNVSSMADADFLNRGVDMISDILEEYLGETYNRDSRETEVDKINDYRAMLGRLLYRLEAHSERYTFDEEDEKMVTTIEKDAFRGNAELLLDAVNFGLSSDSTQEIFRNIALIVYGKDKEGDQANNYIDVETRHGARSIKLNASELAVNSLITNLQMALLRERETSGNKYLMTVAE